MTPEALFGRHHLLGQLRPEEAAELLAQVASRAVAAGQTIFRKDDPGDGLYGVLAGRVVATVTSPSGKELILNRFGPGEFFGEIALLDGKGRTANAVAREPTGLMFLARRAFLPFLERRPEVAERMIALLCERLRHTTDLVEDAAFRNVPARQAIGGARPRGRFAGRGDRAARARPDARCLARDRHPPARRLAGSGARRTQPRPHPAARPHPAGAHRRRRVISAGSAPWRCRSPPGGCRRPRSMTAARGRPGSKSGR